MSFRLLSNTFAILNIALTSISSYGLEWVDTEVEGEETKLVDKLNPD